MINPAKAATPPIASRIALRASRVIFSDSSTFASSTSCRINVLISSPNCPTRPKREVSEVVQFRIKTLLGKISFSLPLSGSSLIEPRHSNFIIASATFFSIESFVWTSGWALAIPLRSTPDIMAKLLLNSASGQAQELHLKPGLSRVGRNDGNDIQIEHPSISSFHCEVNCAGDTVTIKDLGSTNGTFIERAPIQEACLAHGQRLQLGSVEMILDAANAQVVAQNSTPVLEATRLKAEPQTAAQI